MTGQRAWLVFVVVVERFVPSGAVTKCEAMAWWHGVGAH